MDFIFFTTPYKCTNAIAFQTLIQMCGKAVSLCSNVLHFSIMNSKPCAISSTLKSDTIVFRLGTQLHFNNIKMEVKLQHNSVCPWIQHQIALWFENSELCFSFEQKKIIEIRKYQYVIRNTEPKIKKRHMQNVKNVLKLVPLTWKLTLISICVTIERDNYSWSPPSIHVQTDRSWSGVR